MIFYKFYPESVLTYRMVKATFLIPLLIINILCKIQNLHQYWYTTAKSTATVNAPPYADGLWNYCDIKCTSFEKIVPGVDFYVANFRDASYRPNFSACYAKLPNGTSVLWNKLQ